MSRWEDYYATLRCLQCGGDLDPADSSEDLRCFASVNRMLVCVSCDRRYPVCDGIPVIFVDEPLTRVTIDSAEYESRLQHARERMRLASRVMGRDLREFRQEGDPADALAWEILFWER